MAVCLSLFVPACPPARTNARTHVRTHARPHTHKQTHTLDLNMCAPTRAYHSHMPRESKSQEQNGECRFRSWRQQNRRSQWTQWCAKAARAETDGRFTSEKRLADVIGGCESGIWQWWTAKPPREANQRWKMGHKGAPGCRCNGSRQTAVHACLFL